MLFVENSSKECEWFSLENALLESIFYFVLFSEASEKR